MITENGYSKEPSIMPEGIVVTFGMEMINEQGGLRGFIKGFEKLMDNESNYWMHKLKNSPQHDILYVYVIIAGRLYYRTHFGGYYKNVDGCESTTADGRHMRRKFPYIVLAPPIVKCPFKRSLKGFQGFRYSTKLF
jgi:hypothetical protein